MTKKKREDLCRDLLAARGWISCWFPLGSDVPDEARMSVKAGPLKSAMLKIDDVLKKLGHISGGSCKK